MTGKLNTVILNYPPVSSVWHLPAGIAYLAGFLESQGHEVVQRYGHIEGLEYVLKENDSKTDGALSIVRNPNSEVQELYNARKIFENVSKAVKTGDIFRVERNNVLYVSQYYDGTIENVLRAVSERENSLWFSYFKSIELPVVHEIKPEVYGISIADERQLIPGLELASLVKDFFPETLVILGGNFWSRAIEAFVRPEFKELFQYCDAIIYREGFKPLEEILATLNLSNASGCVWKRGSEIIVNPPTNEPVDFENIPFPLFDSNIRQWSPDFVPQIYTMSNCPMQCGFCAISAGSDTFLQKPRAMSPRKIAETMIRIGARRFEISDETFPINRQLALGKELRKLEYPATWNCYLTVTDDLLDSARCEALYEAGCRGVQLGLESLSRETLLREVKSWNHPQNYGKILKNLSEAGIQNHVFLLVGFPGEPVQAGLRWLPFLEDYGEYILTIKAGRYRLTKNSPEEIYSTHSRFILPEKDTKPLHLNRDFIYLDQSSSRKRVEAVRDLLEQACRNHWAYGLTSTIPWWVNRGRYTLNELRKMAKHFPCEPEVQHLNRAIAKAKGIIGNKGAISNYQDLVNVARKI